jgi:hypothetical protein
MKTYILITTLILFSFFSFKLTAQDKFEGEIKMKITSEDEQKQPTDLSFLIKEGITKIITAKEEGKVYVIINQIDKKIDIIMNKNNMYMELPMDSTRLKSGLDTARINRIKESITKTGNKKTILGYECEEFLIKDDERIINMWVTKAIIPFMGFGNPRGKGSFNNKIEELTSNFQGFPMELTVTLEDGTVKEKMEVTSIERKTLDKSEFEIPAGYKKLDMPMFKPHDK